MAKKNERSDLWAVVQVMEPGRCLRGKTFSITGHLGLARPEIVRIIQSCGGRFEETPRYGIVTHLVTNKEWNRGTTAEPQASLKLMKALENGIKVISEDELVDMIVKGDAAMRAAEEKEREGRP